MRGIFGQFLDVVQTGRIIFGGLAAAERVRVNMVTANRVHSCEAGALGNRMKTEIYA